jgi:uncharacterized small protein (DUF1192 family)
MRDYRRRQRGEQIKNTTMPSAVVAELLTAQDRIRELEDEVRRLRAELVQRPAAPAAHAFNSRPFTPVPKRGR